MEKYTYKLIPLDALNAKNPFCLRASLKEPALEKSIARYGVVTPIITTGRPEIRVVDGHRRVEAARGCGLKEIPAFEILGSFPDGELFFLGLIANSSQGFSDQDRMRILIKAAQEYSFPKEKMIAEILPLLGLRQEGFVLEEYLSAARLDAGLADLLFAKKIPVRSIYRLKSLSADDQQTLAFVLDKAGFTTNEVLHICEWVRDLLAPQGKTLRGLLQEQNLNPTLEHPVWDSRCKAEKFYEALRGIRSPYLAASEDRFKSLANEICKDAPELRIQASPSFEEEGFSLQAKIRSEQALERLLDWLDRKKKLLNSLFDSKL